MATWFNKARFGMFIHWGIYSAAARGEWLINREHLSYDEYINQYAHKFTAENYNPRQWAQLAKKAGMKYMVLTAKHHDGFCLWDSKTTDFNSMNYGPKRDIVAEYVEAVRAEGLKVGIYFSPADWHHPDYPNAYLRDRPMEWTDEEARKRFVKFYSDQIRELMTNYGKIDLLWYDGCDPQPLDGEVVNKMVYELQPGIVINNRNGEPYDYKCCEQAIRPPKDGSMFEACMTLNDNWGYHEGDDNYKRPERVIELLATVAENGDGNLLLNISPMGDGTVPPESIEILEKVGAWLDKNSAALTDTQHNPFSWHNSAMLTVSGNKVYVIMKKYVSEFRLTEIKNRIKRVYNLADGKDIAYTQNEIGRLEILDTTDIFAQGMMPVIVCEIEGEPTAIVERVNFWIPG